MCVRRKLKRTIVNTITPYLLPTCQSTYQQCPGKELEFGEAKRQGKEITRNSELWALGSKP